MWLLLCAAAVVVDPRAVVLVVVASGIVLDSMMSSTPTAINDLLFLFNCVILYVKKIHESPYLHFGVMRSL